MCYNIVYSNNGGTMSFEFRSGFTGTETVEIVEKADDAKTKEAHMSDYI